MDNGEEHDEISTGVWQEEEPETPKDPMLQLLEKIEDNTGVVRAWVRFFGVLWVISMIIWLSVIASAYQNTPRPFFR